MNDLFSQVQFFVETFSEIRKHISLNILLALELLTFTEIIFFWVLEHVPHISYEAEFPLWAVISFAY